MIFGKVGFSKLLQSLVDILDESFRLDTLELLSCLIRQSYNYTITGGPRSLSLDTEDGDVMDAWLQHSPTQEP